MTNWPRLTETAKPLPGTFCFCQICGHTSSDIRDFEMLQECDHRDRAENRFLVRCKGEACYRVVDEHPRLYHKVPWGQGGPGAFMLLCGDCKLREGFACKSSNLKANGGEGLEVKIGGLPVVHVCFSDGTGGPVFPRPAVHCADKTTG